MRQLGHTKRIGGDATRILQQARLSGPMPWVIAIMSALTAIALAFGLALTNLAANAQAEIAGGLTVQVLEANPALRNSQAEAAVALLANREDVVNVRRVPDAELAALVEPWLGTSAGNGTDAIPIPALIDVRLRGAATQARIADLTAQLARVAPAARIDAQAAWLQPVFSTISSLRYLAVALVVMLAATSAAAVWLAARSALGTNRETIEVIHHLGASDSQIAAIFQRAIGLDAAAGSVAGLALAVGVILLLGQQFGSLGSHLVAGGGLTVQDWLALACLPIASTALAMLTARMTVLLALRRML